MEESEQCPKCKGFFKVVEHHGGGPGKEKEPIDCPHVDCNYSYKVRSAGYFLTHIVEPDTVE